MNTTPMKKQIDATLAQLETLTDEIRVQLDLAGMEVTETWNTKYEPLLFEAREHAKAAKDASKAAIDDTIKAFKKFQQSL